jgi:hypothetical protein
MNETMTWADAVAVLARRQTDTPEWDLAVETIADELSYENQECRDWVAEGAWAGNETLAQIEAEWEGYNG